MDWLLHDVISFFFLFFLALVIGLGSRRRFCLMETQKGLKYLPRGLECNGPQEMLTE